MKYKLSPTQADVLIRLRAGDELEHHMPTNAYVIGRPSRGWNRIAAPTVRQLIDRVLIAFDMQVGYCRRAKLTREGHAVARQLAARPSEQTS